jgi:DinB family protein
MSEDVVRAHLSDVLDWKSAHAGFDAAVEGIPENLRGRRAEGLPHSPWELLEHMRIAQRDILEFCIDPHYKEMKWPADYWPPAGQQPTATQWEKSLAEFRADRQELKRLAAEADLYARIPHGTGQTILREILLVSDHNAYHVGQLVLVRRALGAWRSP